MGAASSGTIDRFFEDGRRAWPGVLVSRESFEAYVRERAPDESGLAALHGTDLYLACACAAEAPRALDAFDARYVAEVPAFLRGVESATATIEEVRQLVRHRLFVAEDKNRRKILEYSGRGSLGSWFRVVVLRVASNRRRDDGKPRVALSDDAIEDELVPALDPELAIIQRRYKDSFDEALRLAFASLTPRERLLFRMHYIDGLNLDRMGLVLSVHRATVARWLAAAREAVLERTMSLLGDQFQFDATEFRSLLRVVRSVLDVSLQGILSEAPADDSADLLNPRCGAR